MEEDSLGQCGQMDEKENLPFSKPPAVFTQPPLEPLSSWSFWSSRVWGLPKVISNP